MIGVIGGTFDPIHFGHLRTALDVQEAAGIRRMHFVPLREAVHREQPGTPAELRCAMVQAAVADQPGFVMDDRELHRPGPSYSYHTLLSLREQFTQEPLCFLMGMDAFQGFLDWHRPHDILKLAHLVIMHRPETEWDNAELSRLVDQHRTDNPAELHQNQCGKITFQPVTQLDISATDIRQRIAYKKSVRFLLPDSVSTIIEHLGLYR